MFDIFCPGNRQIRDESGAAERVGGGSECRGTSVSDVQISVRHCSDVIIVNTHSERSEETGKTIDRDRSWKSVSSSRLVAGIAVIFSFFRSGSSLETEFSHYARNARDICRRGGIRKRFRAGRPFDSIARMRRLQNVSEVGSPVDR